MVDACHGTGSPRRHNLVALESRTAKGRRQRMLTATLTELLDYGLLSGLHAQSEISELLEEIYYEGLS
jgi:hypothetical protein